MPKKRPLRQCVGCREVYKRQDVPEGPGAAGQAQGGVQDGASLRRGGPGEGQLQAGQQGPLRVHQPPLHAAAGGAGPLDMVGPAPLQQGPGQGRCV